MTTSVGYLSSLNQVSVSQLQGMRQCALREIWSAAKKPVLLPINGSAILGTIIHQLLKEAESGQIQLSTNEFDKRWNWLVQNAECKLQTSIVNRLLVPLAANVFDFEVQKERTKKLILSMAAMNNRHRGLPVSRRSKATEMTLQSKDGLIIGRADLVQTTPEGVIISDYKTGSIWEDKDKRRIKREYLEQLKLYGALFCELNNVDSLFLEVQGLDGSRWRIKFYRSEGQQLLNDAVCEIKRVNAVLKSLPDSNTCIKLFANPSETSCSRCGYRPCCPAYHAHRRTFPSKSKLCDVIGICSALTRLGNGTWLIRVIDTSSRSTLTIRGLRENEVNKLSLSQLSPGCWAGIYNLKASKTSEYFETKNQTVVYKFTDDLKNTLGAL